MEQNSNETIYLLTSQDPPRAVRRATAKRPEGGMASQTLLLEEPERVEVADVTSPHVLIGVELSRWHQDGVPSLKLLAPECRFLQDNPADHCATVEAQGLVEDCFQIGTVCTQVFYIQLSRFPCSLCFSLDEI